MGYNPLINGIYWGYSPLANLLQVLQFFLVTNGEFSTNHKKFDSAGPQNEFKWSCFLNVFFECEQQEQHGRYTNDIHKVSAEKKTICPATPYEKANDNSDRDLSGHTPVGWVWQPKKRHGLWGLISAGDKCWQSTFGGFDLLARAGGGKWNGPSELDQGMEFSRNGLKVQGETRWNCGAMKQSGCSRCMGDEILPSYVGIMINRYMDAS